MDSFRRALWIAGGVYIIIGSMLVVAFRVSLGCDLPYWAFLIFMAGGILMICRGVVNGNR